MKTNRSNEELFAAISRLGRLAKSEVISIHGAEKYTILQLEILMYLRREKKAKSVDIANHFRVTKSTASIHMRKLERSQLIQKARDKSDHRIDWISLTIKGEEMLAGALKEKQVRMNKFLSLIPENDRKQLLNIIKNLIAILEEKYEKTK